MNNEFIGVKHFDELVSVVNGRVSELVENHHIEESYSLESYKSAFEMLAKCIRGYAEAHDNGSLLLSIVMNASKGEDENTFMLIQNELAGEAVE